MRLVGARETQNSMVSHPPVVVEHQEEYLSCRGTPIEMKSLSSILRLPNQGSSAKKRSLHKLSGDSGHLGEMEGT